MKLIWILQKVVARLFRVQNLDRTGAKLVPGDPEHCQGNGEHPGFECCCDNCDYALECFPEFDQQPSQEEMEWEVATDEEAWPPARCPKCHTACREDEYTGKPILSNFCPECGLKLRKPVDQN